MGAYAMAFVLKSEVNLFGSQFSLHHVGLSVKSHQACWQEPSCQTLTLTFQNIDQKPGK